MFSDLYEQVLIAQDAVIELMEQKIELQKHLNSTDERIIKWEKKVKELKNKIDNIEEDIAKESGYEKEDNTIQITMKRINENLKYTLQTKNTVNMLVNPIEIPVTTKRNKLIPILTLNYFKKKGKKDD